MGSTLGLALLVSKEDQFPLFHKTYCGNKNDVTVFKENCSELLERLRHITKELTDVTLVFDKGNNSKENFDSDLDDFNSLKKLNLCSNVIYKTIVTLILCGILIYFIWYLTRKQYKDSIEYNFLEKSTIIN